MMHARSATSATLFPTAPLHKRVWSAVRRTSASVVAYAARRRDAYVAAVLYQELSKLSDAELERRGFARGDLHRHVRSSSGHWYAS